MFQRCDVPLEKDASARFLPWLIGFMVYLAALALAASIAVTNLATQWDTGLSGRMTVQIPPPPGDAEPSAGPDRIATALDVLRSQPGVTRAEEIGSERMQDLLEPWLGAGASTEGLPLPRLIAVVVDPGRAPTAATLEQAIAPAVPGVRVDNHQKALGEVLDIIWWIKLMALLVLALVAGAAIITVVFVTRTGLAVHRRVIELLHLIGAQDGYVAGQFQQHAMRLGLIGGLLGLGMALLTILVLTQVLGAYDSAVIPQFHLGPWQWALLLLLPLLTALVATVTARVTVLRTLARLG